MFLNNRTVNIHKYTILNSGTWFLDLYHLTYILLPGIYVGDGKVIHFTNEEGSNFSSCPSKLRNFCETCGDQSRSHGVTISCLDCFLSGGDLYLFRYSVSGWVFIAQARGGTGTRASSDPCDEVLHRVRYLLDHNGFVMYNTFRNNCEDFAVYCKTGLLIRMSGQTSTLKAAGAAIASSSLCATTPGLIVVGVVYCVGRYKFDIGSRRDTIKISVENLVAYCTLLKQHRDWWSLSSWLKNLIESLFCFEFVMLYAAAWWFSQRACFSYWMLPWNLNCLRAWKPLSDPCLFDKYLLCYLLQYDHSLKGLASLIECFLET